MGILIGNKQNPTGRTLVLDGTVLKVMTSCCFRGMTHDVELNVHRCNGCGVTVMSVIFVSEVDLSNEHVRKLPMYMWGRWLETWFELKDAEVNIEWQE